MRVTRRTLLILTVAALIASFLAFGLSGVAFAQDEPAIVADDFTEDEKCADLKTNYEDFVVEGNAEQTAEVAEEIEFCLAQIIESQE
jgi:hypothetical protein